MTEQEKAIYNRSELLLGSNVLENIRQKRVILFGVGGVGSWCAESLVRNGICHLTLVDSDRVCISNCNRQLMATTKTLGKMKVDVLRERLLEINPQADIQALQTIYNEDTADSFQLESYDFIIDAIDSLKDKVHLILNACHLAHVYKHITFLSSMGAALHLDPTQVKVAEFWKIKGDPLARALRNKFKRTKEFPENKFLCVYSEEKPLENQGIDLLSDGSGSMFNKVQTNGSLSHVTGIFGFTLAGLVIKKIKEG